VHNFAPAGICSHEIKNRQMNFAHILVIPDCAILPLKKIPSQESDRSHIPTGIILKLKQRNGDQDHGFIGKGFMAGRFERGSHLRWRMFLRGGDNLCLLPFSLPQQKTFI
jgi:hypothetical protein